MPRIAPNYRVMAYAKLIGPSPVSTPSSLLRSGTRSREIPDDLLREASLRLGILSLLGAVLWTVGTLAGHLAAGALAGGNHAAWASFETTDTIAVVMVIVSLSLFAYARRSKQDPTVILGHRSRLSCSELAGAWHALACRFASAWLHAYHADLMGRRAPPDVRGNRAGAAAQNARRRFARGVNESHRNVDRARQGCMGFWIPERCVVDALP